MQGLQISFQVAILSLAALSLPETASHFRCDTPVNSHVGPTNVSPGQLWPDAIVPYFLNTSLTDSDIEEVMKAIDDVEKKTCIRFVVRGSESTYVSIERDDSIDGGEAQQLCRVEGYQYAKFGKSFRFANVMVHEFGHLLCLSHEMNRKDRDDFVSFDKDQCRNGQVPQSKDDFDTRGYLYDYTSNMHYPCKWCPGGRPKMEGVTNCGLEVQNGLSVEDADKLNDIYSCTGCFSHRWRSTETLTDDEKKGELVSFGKTVESKDLYVCRTYSSQGEISPGQYDLDSNICTVTFNGTRFQVEEKVQVFTVPGEDTRERYQVLEPQDNLVPVGRTKNALSIYAAVVTDPEGNSGQFIGKVYADDLSKAFYSSGDTEVMIQTDFLFIVCN